MNLFDKAIVFTDLHFGKKSNSLQFNQDCLDYIDWLCSIAKSKNIKTAIFLGDWHDNRSNLNVSTLNYSLKALDKLDNTFDKIHIIPGNHDEYYKDRRDVNSIEFVRKFNNFVMYNEITKVDNCLFVPWLIGEEHKTLKDIDADFVFGHFELPSFLMNAMMKMPDIGELNSQDFKKSGIVLSGHFHKRQSQKNIHYIGNAFPHDYNDAWDDDRGLAILSSDKSIEYVNWPDCPKYRRLKLSQLLSDVDLFLKEKTYAKVALDLEISYDEANFIKEVLSAQYNLRDFSLTISSIDEQHQDYDGEIDFESVDTIVTSQLQQVDSSAFDTNFLLKLYREL